LLADATNWRLGCEVLLDQIRTIDKGRIGGRIGGLSSARLQEVEQTIRISIALPP
jgi:mRNA-degrading endonuclease toxin of MazEF toxin-antitoxin module